MRMFKIVKHNLDALIGKRFPLRPTSTGEVTKGMINAYALDKVYDFVEYALEIECEEVNEDEECESSE